MKSIIVIFAFVNNVFGQANKAEVDKSCLSNNFERELALSQTSLPFADFSTCDRINLIPSKKDNKEVNVAEDGHVILTNLKANKRSGFFVLPGLNKYKYAISLKKVLKNGKSCFLIK